MAIALPRNDFHFPSFINKNKEESMELIPNSSCSKRMSFLERLRRLRAQEKYEEATVSNIPKKTSYLASLAIASSPWKDGQQNVAFDEEKNKPDLAATTANDDEEKNNLDLMKRISFAEHVRRRAKGKYEEATVSNIPKKTSYLPSLAIASSPWEDGEQDVAFDEEKNKPDLAATTANDDDIDNSDELADTDDYDPDASPRSPVTCKKSKWFKKFMKGLEYLSNEGEMNDPNRQWYCPVCKLGNSADSIRRYRGLHTLIRHAKRKMSNRARLHRELAQLLEQKLQTDKARSAHPAAEEYAKLVGLKVGNKDHEIVWPPMVVIANAFYKQDGTNNLILITNQQLVDMFSSSYDCIVEAQNSYEWNQHGGTSMLIFESSARGYLEAERLHKHFEEEGIGRSQSTDFITGDGPRICGYLALKEDVDFFNPYLSKPKLKYEMRSYQEIVVNGIRQMSEENHELVLLKKGVAEQQQQAKVLEEGTSELKEKLQIAKKEMDTVRSKIIQHNQQKMEEMEFQKQFFEDAIRKILALLKKEVAEQQQQAKVLEECNSKLKEMLQIAMKEMDTMRSKIMQQKQQKTEEMEFQGQLCQHLIRKILESRKYKNSKKMRSSGGMNTESVRIKAMLLHFQNRLDGKKFFRMMNSDQTLKSHSSSTPMLKFVGIAFD